MQRRRAPSGTYWNSRFFHSAPFHHRNLFLLLRISNRALVFYLSDHFPLVTSIIQTRYLHRFVNHSKNSAFYSGSRLSPLISQTVVFFFHQSIRDAGSSGSYPSTTAPCPPLCFYCNSANPVSSLSIRRTSTRSGRMASRRDR